MATTAMNLSVPAPADDSMEMSSPGHNNLDEDIDFEFDEPGGPLVNEDDRMVDDGEQPRPGIATDDVMEDDTQQAQQTEAVVHEEVMQDSPSQEQQEEDEELIDYSDDELQDEVVADAITQDAIEQASDTAPVRQLEEEHADEEAAHGAGDEGLELLAEDFVEAPAVVQEPSAAVPSEVTSPLDAAPNGANPSVDSPEQLQRTDVDSHEEDATKLGEEHSEDQVKNQHTSEEADAQALALSVDTDAQAPADGPATPTDTGLHAMTIWFGDHQFPLFTSRSQPEGLLKNDNLVSLSLGELIQNCRQRLAVKAGESISDDQDMVLGFEQLGLALVEDSRATFECSLDEILDIYLQLHRNDEIEDIPPFSLRMSLQMKFTSSISVLKQAAAGGEGMSSFGFHHSEENEEAGEYYADYAAGEDTEGQEGYDQQYQEDGLSGEHEQDQEAQVEGSIPEQQQAHTNEYRGAHDGPPADNGEYEDHFQDHDQNYDELADGQDFGGNQDEAARKPDDSGQALGEDGLDESGDVAHNGLDDLSRTEDSRQKPFDATGEERTASTATSTTFQGDEGQDTTEQSATNEADFSSVLEDHEDRIEDSQSAQTTNEQYSVEEDLAHSRNGGHDHEADQTVHYTIDNQAPNAEDYPDGPAQDEDEAATNNEESYEIADADAIGASVQGLEPVNEEADRHSEFDQAGDQPGEDGETYETAYELFDTAEDEVPLAQDAPNDGVEGTTLVAATADGEHNSTDDFIDFDDEITFEETNLQKGETTAAGSRTPLAKRSFEDLAGDDEIDFGTPEPKKARAS